MQIAPSLRALARELEVSEGTIRRWRRDRGLPLEGPPYDVEAVRRWAATHVRPKLDCGQPYVGGSAPTPDDDEPAALRPTPRDRRVLAVLERAGREVAEAFGIRLDGGVHLQVTAATSPPGEAVVIELAARERRYLAWLD